MEVSVVRGAAGWAHCVAVTGNFDFLVVVLQLRGGKEKEDSF